MKDDIVTNKKERNEISDNTLTNGTNFGIMDDTNHFL